MSRRICLLLLAGVFALAAPAATFAQSSSQAQYQGVAPETSTPITGSGGTPGNSGATTQPGGGATSNGGSTGGTTSGASGNGGGGAGAPTSSGGGSAQAVAAPNASSDTAPFSGGDFLWIVLACAGLVGLGFLLRRATRAPASI